MAKVIVTTEEELEALIRKVLKDTLSPMMVNPNSGNFVPIPEIMTITQASEFIGIAKQTVYGFTSKRQIPHFKRGKRLYFKKNELIEWLTQNKRKTMDEMLADYERNIERTRRGKGK